MRELTVAAAVKELERGLVGKDPRNVERFWHDAYRDAYWRGGPVLMTALAGVEMALWDIKGKALGVPVYELLGGRVRDSVPCYADGWFTGAREPEEFARKAAACDAGFRALKWDPFGSSYMNLGRADLDRALRCVGAVADAVGTRADLIIEGHGRFNVPTAIRVGQALKDFRVLWFEEPIPPDNVEALADVRSPPWPSATTCPFVLTTRSDPWPTPPRCSSRPASRASICSRPWRATCPTAGRSPTSGSRCSRTAACPSKTRPGSASTSTSGPSARTRTSRAICATTPAH